MGDTAKRGDDFPPGIGRPAIRALHTAGVDRVDQLSDFTESELMRLHGMGPKALGILRSALAERGRSFRHD